MNTSPESGRVITSGTEGAAGAEEQAAQKMQVSAKSSAASFFTVLSPFVWNRYRGTPKTVRRRVYFIPAVSAGSVVTAACSVSR